MSFIGNSVLLRIEYRTGAHYLVVAEDDTQRYFSIPSSLDVNFRTAEDINSSQKASRLSRFHGDHQCQ